MDAHQPLTSSRRPHALNPDHLSSSTGIAITIREKSGLPTPGSTERSFCPKRRELHYLIADKYVIILYRQTCFNRREHEQLAPATPQPAGWKDTRQEGIWFKDLWLEAKADPKSPPSWVNAQATEKRDCRRAGRRPRPGGRIANPDGGRRFRIAPSKTPKLHQIAGCRHTSLRALPRDWQCRSFASLCRARSQTQRGKNGMSRGQGSGTVPTQHRLGPQGLKGRKKATFRPKEVVLRGFKSPSKASLRGAARDGSYLARLLCERTAAFPGNPKQGGGFSDHGITLLFSQEEISSDAQQSPASCQSEETWRSPRLSCTAPHLQRSSGADAAR